MEIKDSTYHCKRVTSHLNDINYTQLASVLEL